MALPTIDKSKPKKLNIKLAKGGDELAIGRTVMVYGDSGLGKSTLLSDLALKLHRKYNKKVRLIAAEDSSKSIFLPLIRAGIVEAVFITQVPELTDVMRELSRGKWLNDAGELVEGGLQDVCAYLIEGFTSISEGIQENNRDNRRFLGEQKENTYTTEGGETLALPGKFSYGFVQLEMIRYARAFAMLPGVERVVWSAHENKGTEDGKPIKGPGSVGTAATDKIQKHVGMLLHLDMVKGKRVLHFDRHQDPDTPLISYPSRLSVSLAGLRYFHEKLGTQAKYIEPQVGPDGSSIVNGIFELLEAEEYANVKLEESYAAKS